MKFLAACLAVLTFLSAATAEANGANGKKNEPKPAIVDSIAGDASTGNLTIGARKIPEAPLRDPAKEVAEKIRKLKADMLAGNVQSGSIGSTWNDGDMSHVVECVNGNTIEREYYTTGCHVSTLGNESGTVTTIKDDKGKLLETIEWRKTGATIKDAAGKVLETRKWKP